MKNYSQARQDLFVIKMLDNKQNGIYVEVGGHEPIHINNTYLLEKDFNWTGFSIEWDSNLCNMYNSTRRNICYNQDALKFDFDSEIAKILNGGNQIDYLSLDIEPSRQTFDCLKRIPHESVRFSVITFEHDSYREGNAVRDECRKFLFDLGYQLVVADVKNEGNPYEDWWIDPRVISEDTWRPFFRSNIEHSQLGL